MSSPISNHETKEVEKTKLVKLANPPKGVTVLVNQVYIILLTEGPDKLRKHLRTMDELARA